jgi:hypothetical protein
MAHKNFSEPLQAYMSRGQRIMSVLSGEGIVDVIPGFPDAKFDSQSQSAMDRFDPEIDFDPNSYSRIDKFDGLEVGQELVDSALTYRNRIGCGLWDGTNDDVKNDASVML